ncbi:MAG TPA: metallophosphoesterase [Thermoanaerobaculia bacterium]|jgi:hypothetical protein|nr:metallophosphoesterase [Thermoanaerobaculia bacterium]
MSLRPAASAFIALAALLALAALCHPSGAFAQTAPSAVIAAAGDIACDPADANFNGGAGMAAGCHMKATSDLLVGAGYDAVLLLGDNQYEDGALAKYQASYDPSWGRLKAITRPAPGNHEYITPGAAGYYAYFGAAAGDPAKGWGSFDLGGWHFITLNSNCAAIGGCGPGSPQEQWLANDLAAHPGVCTLAYWHHPRFSSGPHGSDATFQTLWDDLYAAGADVVLNGHDHIYERFAPQTPAGAADPARGIRQFVVGTGGKNHTSIVQVQPNSEVRDAATFGVLELTLYPNGYAWRFRTEAGQTFTDSGIGLCHAALPGPAADYYTVAPCRLLDTRQAIGPSGGPSLAAGTARTFPVGGVCAVPAGASAVAVNVTAVNPATAGFLQLYPAGAPVPVASTLNAGAGQTRANNAVLPLGPGGQATVRATLAAGTVDLVVDVMGYFR